MVLCKLRHPEWYCCTQNMWYWVFWELTQLSAQISCVEKANDRNLAHTHRTVNFTCRLPPSRILMFMGVTDTDPSLLSGISLSHAVAFKYHVPETWRRYLAIRTKGDRLECL